MSTHNIGFYEEISKIIPYHQISSNMHLISFLRLHPQIPVSTHYFCSCKRLALMQMRSIAKYTTVEQMKRVSYLLDDPHICIYGGIRKRLSQK